MANLLNAHLLGLSGQSSQLYHRLSFHLQFLCQAMYAHKEETPLLISS